MATLSLNDKMFQSLGNLGYTGALNDRLHAFWVAQGYATFPGNDTQAAFYSKTSNQSLNDAAVAYWSGSVSGETWASITQTWAQATETWANV